MMSLEPVPRLLTPPGRTGQPYISSLYDGEMIYIPVSLSNTRLLVTGKETENAFAIVSSGGTASAPIGFHKHREAHDVFLCLKGQCNVWANNQCRTLSQGDFASVPPGVVHQYQIISQHTEFVGLIVPGGWEEFFRFIGEPYSGCLFPTSDDRNPMDVLVPKLIAATEKFDMIPVRDHPYVAPQPWKSDGDDVLPHGTEPYFLRDHSGPKWILGGIICRPLITETQSAGRFSIASLEGSNMHSKHLIHDSKGLKFDKIHHCILVMDGSLTVSIEGSTVKARAGELVYIPSQTVFKFSFSSTYSQSYIFANGGGISKVIQTLGKPYDAPTIPDKPVGDWSDAHVSELGEALGYTLA